MSKPVDEWVEKAEEDFHVALSLGRARRYSAHNAVCFHAQQCVEKYLKAILEKQASVDGKIAIAIMKQTRVHLRAILGLP